MMAFKMKVQLITWIVYFINLILNKHSINLIDNKNQHSIKLNAFIYCKKIRGVKNYFFK